MTAGFEVTSASILIDSSQVLPKMHSYAYRLGGWLGGWLVILDFEITYAGSYTLWACIPIDPQVFLSIVGWLAYSDRLFDFMRLLIVFANI